MGQQNIYLLIVFAILYTILTSTVVSGHALCDFATSRNLSTTGSASAFINNFSASKCLRIEQMGHFPRSKLHLDGCFWSRTAVTKDENFYITKSDRISDGVIIKNDAAQEKYCLTTISGVLATTQCSASSQAILEQTWRLKPVSGKENQFLIQQVSSSNCLVPRTRNTRSLILLAPCNSYQTEQIWNICMTFQLTA